MVDFMQPNSHDPGQVAIKQAQNREKPVLLTKHEGETFHNQTVYISGQAFVNCTFIACTLVLRETVYHLDQCAFERCNWHVDWVLLWGSPESLREIKALVEMIEKAQAEMPAQSGDEKSNGDQSIGDQSIGNQSSGASGTMSPPRS